MPGAIGAKFLMEGIEVAPIGVQPQIVLGNKCRVRELKIEGALTAQNPAQIGIVSQYNSIVAALAHKCAHTGYTPIHTRSIHGLSFV